MADAEIHYKLDLIVRLVDTTTGKKVEQKQVIFKIQDEIVPLVRRDEGVYVLLNHGRSDMELRIEVLGYLASTVFVKYEELSTSFPEVEIPLIPEVGTTGYVDMLTIEGQRKGLTVIEAVALIKTHGVIANYQEKKQNLKLYSAKSLDESTYAIIHEQQQEFEEFYIKKRVDKLSLKLASPLKTPCKPEEKIARIIRGRVDEKGRYLLRILEEGGGAEYLVRYVIDGKESFKRISVEKINPFAEDGEETN